MSFQDKPRSLHPFMGGSMSPLLIYIISISLYLVTESYYYDYYKENYIETILTDEYNIYMGLYNDTSCNGIDYFYTGKGFIFDVKKSEQIYDKKYDTNESEKYNEPILMPINLTQKEIKGYDCEDYAKLLMCLAEMYNKTCKYYIFTGINIGRHTGIYCLEGDKWVRYS